MVEAGWVFRLEIVTTKPATTTKQIMDEIGQRFLESELISRYRIDELFEDIKLFKKQEEG